MIGQSVPAHNHGACAVSLLVSQRLDALRYNRVVPVVSEICARPFTGCVPQVLAVRGRVGVQYMGLVRAPWRFLNESGDTVTMIDQESDAQLVVHIANGDRGALARLYDRYSGVMFSTSVRILGDRREAEDLLHDVFLEVWKKAGDYDASRGTVRTWLLMRLRSRALDRCKTARRNRVVSLEEAPTWESRTVPGEDPSSSSDKKAVRRAVRALPDTQRRVLELAYFRGLSSSEIARQLDIPVGTVKSRVAAGLNKLRRSFRESAGGAA